MYLCLASQTSVVLDGEPVCLILDPRHKLEITEGMNKRAAESVYAYFREKDRAPEITSGWETTIFSQSSSGVRFLKSIFSINSAIVTPYMA